MSCLGGEVFSCMYQPKVSDTIPEPELTSFEDCGVISESGELMFTSKHLNQISYDGEGNLACIYTRTTNTSSIYYMNAESKIIETINFDNGCDYFESGLARTRINGKMAYFNNKLEVVLITEYEIASPFYDGIASICEGGQYVQDGEHSFLENAECAYLGLDGKILIDFMPQNKLPDRNDLIIKSSESKEGAAD